MRLPARFAALSALLFFVAPLSQAEIIHYAATLGPEVVGATGSGSVTVDYDTIENTLLIDADWSDLSGTTTVAHIHCCTASAGTGTIGVAVTPGTLPGFPSGVTSGSYTSPLIDLDDPANFTGGFITIFAGGDATAADEALIAGINDALAYFNIHSSTFAGGEIRGFLQQVEQVPEPATPALIGIGIALAGLAFRRRKYA